VGSNTLLVDSVIPQVRNRKSNTDDKMRLTPQIDNWDVKGPSGALQVITLKVKLSVW